MAGENPAKTKDFRPTEDNGRRNNIPRDTSHDLAGATNDDDLISDAEFAEPDVAEPYVRDIRTPFSKNFTGKDIRDFRPIPVDSKTPEPVVEEVEPDPKDLSVQDSVDSSGSVVLEPKSESSVAQEMNATAAKVNTPPRGNAPSTPPS